MYVLQVCIQALCLNPESNRLILNAIFQFRFRTNSQFQYATEKQNTLPGLRYAWFVDLFYLAAKSWWPFSSVSEIHTNLLCLGEMNFQNVAQSHTNKYTLFVVIFGVIFGRFQFCLAPVKSEFNLFSLVNCSGTQSQNRRQFVETNSSKHFKPPIHYLI